MGFWDVTGPDGRTYPKVEAESMEAAIAKVRGQQEPARAVAPPAPAPEMGFGESVRQAGVGGAFGALADSLGGSLSRPGARGMMDVVLSPQGPLENVASVAATSLPVMRAGAMATRAATQLPAIARAVAPAVARTLASGAASGVKKAYQGGDVGEVSYQAAMDTLIAGILETGLGGGSQALSYLKSKPVDAKAVKDAMDAARSLLPMNRRFIFPALGGTTKMTLDEAAEKLADLRGVAYKVARDEVGRVLDAMTKVNQVTGAGERFLARSPAPGTYATIADWLSGANRTRGIADAALTGRDEEGMPNAAPAAMATGGAYNLGMGAAGSLLSPFASALMKGVGR